MNADITARRPLPPAPYPADPERRQSGRAAAGFLTILVLAVIAGLGFWLGQRSPRGAGNENLETARPFPQTVAIQPFQLDAVDNGHLTNADLKGHWTLIFFGFTHCPDVCPTTLAKLRQAAIWWKDVPEPQRPQVWFVSVDPDRDAAADANRYAQYFNPDFIGTTAKEPQLGVFARGLGMVYARQDSDSDPDGYTMDHSASIVLIDPEGNRAGLIRPPLEPDAIGRDLLRLGGFDLPSPAPAKP